MITHFEDTEYKKCKFELSCFFVIHSDMLFFNTRTEAEYKKRNGFMYIKWLLCWEKC